ncbi:NAD-dependent epimerase [Spirochaetia bacterium]|nr:NAD-dependent epimerase [Spirochaetia bacterium]
MNILVTGTAGFIGFHLAERLCGAGHNITGIDNINDYYDVDLKYARLEYSGIQGHDNIPFGKRIQSAKFGNYSFIKTDITDKAGIEKLFTEEQFNCVIHLAAQAGVRYSLENPGAYINSNIGGFFNILEACRRHNTAHLIFASSSSVYGLNQKTPFSTADQTDRPASLYAATKKSNELMAFSYSHLYNIPTTGLRFFTVYGPWGRPDMAPFIFTKSVIEGKPVKVFNNGNMKRDFTYIDDIIEGITGLIDKIPPPSPAPCKIYNIGCGRPVDLPTFIETIERSAGKKAHKEFLPMQDGDVPVTWADTKELAALTGYTPITGIETGIPKFIEWYKSYYEKT